MPGDFANNIVLVNASHSVAGLLHQILFCNRQVTGGRPLRLPIFFFFSCSRLDLTGLYVMLRYVNGVIGISSVVAIDCHNAVALRGVGRAKGFIDRTLLVIDT